MSKQLIDLAEAQLLGFFHHRRGYDLKDLVSSMGLTKSEWIEIQAEYDLAYMEEEDKKDITDFLIS